MNQKTIAYIFLIFWGFNSWAQSSDPLVPIQSIIPDAVIDLRYATKNNFMKMAVYPKGAQALLKKSVALKLAKAADVFHKRGYRIKIYDAYRPLSVQWELWKVKPDAHYVADPRKGSNHNRGIAVDMTLIDEKGIEISMPSEYDDLSPRGHHNSKFGTKTQLEHSNYLKSVMEDAGFKATRTEWWHYHDPEKTNYPLLDDPPMAGQTSSQ